MNPEYIHLRHREAPDMRACDKTKPYPGYPPSGGSTAWCPNCHPVVVDDDARTVTILDPETGQVAAQFGPHGAQFADLPVVSPLHDPHSALAVGRSSRWRRIRRALTGR